MPVEVILVTGGRWHDSGYARLELLAALDRDDGVRVTVRDGFDVDALATADALISYTCEVPLEPAETALEGWLARGGRWLALHATCSALDVVVGEDRTRFRARVGAADRLLGGSFVAHPPIAPYRVEVAASGDPLVAGLEPFETTDELYACRLDGGVEVLLDTGFGGLCPGFLDSVTGADVVVAPGRQPVLWRRRHGPGQVLVLTLGHCRGRFDLADLGVGDLGARDRRAWDSAGFREVLDRCLSDVVREGSR